MNGKRVTCQEIPNMIESVKEIAETKSFEVNNLAQTNEHPLKSIIEPCEE